MNTLRSTRPRRQSFAALTIGFSVSIIATPLFFGVGFLLGYLFLIVGFEENVLASVVFTCITGFVGCAGAGRWLGASSFMNPLPFAIGIGIVPILAFLGFFIVLEDSQPDSALIPLLLFLAVAAAQALGGYIGCSSSRPKPHRQLGIGHTCANCNYNLSATPDHQPCPECGRMYRLSNTPPSAAPPEGP
jgi:hypothetical protein